MAEMPTMKVAMPGNMLVTLSWTLTLDQWREFRLEIGNSWPGSDLAVAVDRLVTKTQQTFYAGDS